MNFRCVCNVIIWVGVAVAMIASTADGLSDSICNNIEAEWQSDEPRLEGAFPFYTLLGGFDGPACRAQSLQTYL